MFYLSSIQLYFHRKHSDLFVKTKEMCSAGNIQKTPEWSKALQSHSLSPLVHSNQAAKKLQKKNSFTLAKLTAAEQSTRRMFRFPYRRLFHTYEVCSTIIMIIFMSIQLLFILFSTIFALVPSYGCRFRSFTHSFLCAILHSFFFFFSLLLLFLPSVCEHLKMIKFSVHHIQEQHGAG